MNSKELEASLTSASIALLMARDMLRKENFTHAEKAVEYATELIIKCNLSISSTKP